MMKQLFARKTLDQLNEEMQSENRLHRVLGPVQLTSLGVGAIIGTGIFVLVGRAANETAGPALMLSFVVAGLACVFAALCYAEFASMAPVSGSAYTYAYATLGELMAWIIGWDLVLEYSVAAATVAHGWSKYFQDFISLFNWRVPTEFSDAPIKYEVVGKIINGQSVQVGEFAATGTWFDLPALVISLLVTIVLVLGIRQSTWFNTAMVVIKVGVVLFVIAVGVFYINPDNWAPFAPYGYGGLNFFGWEPLSEVQHQRPHGPQVGMLAGAAAIFFAYIGFDSVSTHSEEAKNPQRDLPIGIVASLVICTVLYVAMAAVLTGMVPYDKISIEAPVSKAFEQIGLTSARYVISLGALCGITSVLLVMMLSQPRVLLAMARDGLIPQDFFGAVHPTFRTPHRSTILTGVFVAAMSSLLPLGVLAELVNIGTLLAFVIVCAAVLIMRYTNPDAPRPFRVPLVPVVPILGIVFCLALMFALPWENWVRLGVWLLIGFVIYFTYGIKHSNVAKRLAMIEASELEAEKIELGSIEPDPIDEIDDGRPGGSRIGDSRSGELKPKDFK